MSVRSTCQSSKEHGSVFKSRDISTGTSGHLSFVNKGWFRVHFTKSAESDAMVSSNSFGVDCISNLSDRSPDSDSERDSGSMIVVLRVSV